MRSSECRKATLSRTTPGSQHFPAVSLAATKIIRVVTRQVRSRARSSSWARRPPSTAVNRKREAWTVPSVTPKARVWRGQVKVVAFDSATAVQPASVSASRVQAEERRRPARM